MLMDTAALLMGCSTTLHLNRRRGSRSNALGREECRGEREGKTVRRVAIVNVGPLLALSGYLLLVYLFLHHLVIYIYIYIYIFVEDMEGEGSGKI